MREYIKNLKSGLRKVFIFDKNKRYLAENMIHTSEKQAIIISISIIMTPLIIAIVTKALA